MDEDFKIFRSEELWRPSIFTVDGRHQDSIFDGLRLDVESSLATKESQGNLFGGLAREFDLPPLEDVSLDAELEKGVTDDVHPEQAFGEPPTNQVSEVDEENIWDLHNDSLPLDTGPRLHTWEAFQFGNQQPSSNTHYLSEAGDRAFDAAISQHEQYAGIISRDVVVRACCSLVLGRSSTFFQWDPTKRVFTQTLEKVALSGASLESSQSLVQAFMQSGTAFRELNTFVTRTKIQEPTTLVALKRSINAALDLFERYICERITHIRSLLQLQQAIGNTTSILMHLCKSARDLAGLDTDEDIISALSDEVTRLAESGHFLSGVMREVLAGVSMPWLQRLAEDVGLLPRLTTHGRESTSTDTIAGAISAESTETSFLTQEDLQTVSSVKRSISLLRQHVPDHPLSSNDGTLLGLDVLEATRGPESDSTARLAEKYQNEMTEAIIRHHQGLQPQGTTPQFLKEYIPSSNESMDPFALTELDESGFQHDQDPEPSPKAFAGLERALAMALEDATICLGGRAVHVDDSILAPLRPFIEVQASLVNSAVMGYMFRTYDIRSHLELHRAYHLFGNGDFVTRLTTALFSDEVQSAERKRGNIPTSETMGLRLGSRESQRWPPASSELRLTLLDVLTDSYNPKTDSSQDVQLPGGLSFAIRELTDAEIDRVMDPTSIYALDFLRLQYTPPGPLADIFTSTIVQHYDSIFRTLLMHVRVLHATSRLCNSKLPKPTTSLQRFAWKSRHFSTTLFSHFTDTVIAEAWKDFASNLAALEPSPSSLSPDNNAFAQATRTAADLPSITRLHERCLDDIRSKMFLRRKHDKIRSVVEQMAGIVVRVTAMAVHGLKLDGPMGRQEQRFDELGRELASSLEGIASKLGKDTSGGLRTLQTEAEAAGLLLARFDWEPKGGEGGGG